MWVVAVVEVVVVVVAVVVVVVVAAVVVVVVVGSRIQCLPPPQAHQFLTPPDRYASC